MRNADSGRSASAGRCRDVLAIVARLFRLWRQFRGDLRDRRRSPQPIARTQLIKKSLPLQRKLFVLAEAHLDHPNSRPFVFVEKEDVSPTNNVAEGVLRTAAHWCKTGFGNRTDRGESLPQRACLRSHKSAGGNSDTFWVTSPKLCAAVGTEHPHSLSSPTGLTACTVTV